MNNNTNKNDIQVPEEVLQLVPWYAIGKLSVEDQVFFEKALSKYPDLSGLVQEERQIVELASADHSILNKSAIAIPEERLKAVFNMIDVAERKNQINDTDVGSSVLAKLKSAFDFLVPTSIVTPKYARAASAAVLVVSIAVLTAFVAPLFTQTSEFVPASADNQKNTDLTTTSVASNTVLLVGFNGTMTELGNIDVLKGKLLKIKSVPDKDGIYQISFKQALSSAEIEKTINALLLQKDMIWFAGEAF